MPGARRPAGYGVVAAGAELVLAGVDVVLEADESPLLDELSDEADVLDPSVLLDSEVVLSDLGSADSDAGLFEGVLFL